MARKILLADDSVTAQNMGRKILADAGYEVITVNNGSAALKKIAELKPDLIVLDVYMPGYSGLEVCQRLKEAAETSRLPILLTVGKLEPFKPEEAKRVRADGFIVKPFEASELLSALSKLEDKIVPRSETSKPGRFARVTASIEQGRYDKVVTNEDDLGWKDRISFPPKKKHSDQPSTVFDAPKVIEHKLADKPRAAQAEETRVDLGALAPEGLPKDVTPEEIAALAAAAAQVKGTIANAKSEEVASVGAKAEPAQLAEAFLAPLVEHKPEHKPEEKPAEKLTEKIEEEIQATQEINEAAAEAASVAAASPLDVIAAITGLSANAAALPGESSGNGLSSHGVTDQPANEPVTMARAGSEASRWMAVSVGFAPEEAAISLEHEMQKAYAAFAAAVNGQAAPATAVSESAPDWRQSATAAEFSPPPEAALPVESIPALPVPDPQQAFNGLANASTETIRAVVQNLEMVAESYPGETQAAAPADFRQPTTDASQIVEAVAKDNSAAAVAEPQSQSEGFGAAQNHEELKKQDQEPEARKNEDWKNEGWRHENAAPSLVNEPSAEQTAISQSPSYTEAVAANEPPTEGTGEKTAAEAAATTAAAWASWRQVREFGDREVISEERSRKDSEDAVRPQAAAMAVAAGAEKTPDEISAESNSDSDPAAIASIVDSVLADLRPKIFEEISRKMGKKK